MPATRSLPGTEGERPPRLVGQGPRARSRLRPSRRGAAAAGCPAGTAEEPGSRPPGSGPSPPGLAEGPAGPLLPPVWRAGNTQQLMPARGRRAAGRASVWRPLPVGSGLPFGDAAEGPLGRRGPAATDPAAARPLAGLGAAEGCSQPRLRRCVGLGVGRAGPGVTVGLAGRPRLPGVLELLPQPGGQRLAHLVEQLGKLDVVVPVIVPQEGAGLQREAGLRAGRGRAALLLQARSLRH